MDLITNNKLASLAPLWADFRGFTLLFDNPGKSFALEDGVEFVSADEKLKLYSALGETLESIGPDDLVRRFLFLPLDPRSYHVTACDGGNAGNFDKAKASCRGALQRLFDGLPESICEPNPFADLIGNSELITKKDWKLRLAFDYIENCSGISIVARLKPADTESAARVNQFAEARACLCKDLRENFNIDISQHFGPHITLGYFANPDLAKGTAKHIEEWQETFRRALDDLTIEFNSISLCGFTDMETFFRCPPRVRL